MLDAALAQAPARQEGGLARPASTQTLAREQQEQGSGTADRVASAGVQTEVGRSVPVETSGVQTSPVAAGAAVQTVQQLHAPCAAAAGVQTVQHGTSAVAAAGAQTEGALEAAAQTEAAAVGGVEAGVQAAASQHTQAAQTALVQRRHVLLQCQIEAHAAAKAVQAAPLAHPEQGEGARACPASRRVLCAF